MNHSTRLFRATFAASATSLVLVLASACSITESPTSPTEVQNTNTTPTAGPPPPVPAPAPNPNGDQIDPSSIRWLSPASTDVGSWPVTSTITNVTINGDDICIYHSKSGQWPLVSIDGNRPNIEGNPMIVAKFDGQWYGAGFDWFGEGRACKHLPRYEYGRDQIRVWPMDGSWPGPQSGEEVGVLVSTPSSDRIPVRSINERSNIVLVRFP